MRIDVLLFGWKEYKLSLEQSGLDVFQADDFEVAASAIQGANEVKVLLFDRFVEGGSGYDLAQILRATHARCLLGQAIPAVALKHYIAPGKPMPSMVDFWLGETFEVADIVEQVARYDRGEGGPPPGWTGWFTEAKDFDDASTTSEELAWIFEAMT